VGAVIVDDHLLVACLCDREPSAVARARGRGPLYTTGLWYHRLCRAFAAPVVEGALSGRLRRLPPLEARRLVAAVTELPRWIRLMSLRQVAWPMGEILAEERLNLMALEALAAGRLLGATICVFEGNDSPRFRSAAERLGVTVLPVSV
jgi:hypothetical protein